tara:strand:- start:180 stop:455 length:276 start_codon:yes stop_codon:yes gene_type:complete
MTARDTLSYTVGANTTTWFHDFQTESGWGTTPIMATQTTFYLRAFDSGSGGRYVYWSNTGTSPDLSPSATDTTPNTAGSLSLKVIINSVVL